nr:DUF3027 domain-containing protein [Actinomycetota bacterium]
MAIGWAARVQTPLGVTVVARWRRDAAGVGAERRSGGAEVVYPARRGRLPVAPLGGVVPAAHESPGRRWVGSVRAHGFILPHGGRVRADQTPPGGLVSTGAGPAESTGAGETEETGPVTDPSAPHPDAAPEPSTIASGSRGRRTRADAVAAAAVDLARAAATEVGGDQVGEYLGAEADGERVVTHAFAATVPGYRGWYWSVVVARASRARTATVDEVVLLPGDDALRPPPWVPWAERIRPGDLGAGDVLPADPDDDRLVPAYAEDADEEMLDLAFELGLGRP